MKTSTGKLKRKWTSTSPPLPRPPLQLLRELRSVTNQEIANFWRQKRMEEEDHLLAALKAGARIRACNLTEEDYRRFEESLKEEEESTNKYESNRELRLGIKDWWTKSKYAYLNQPAIESMDAPKHTSTYIPNFCFYNAHDLQPSSLLWVL